MKDPKIDINSGDEIVIVVPEGAVKDGELEIDLDELGIDIEQLDETVNIVIQVEGEDFIETELLDDDFPDEPKILTEVIQMLADR